MSNEVSVIVPTAEKKSDVMYLIELYKDKWVFDTCFRDLSNAREYVQERRKIPTVTPLRIVKQTTIEEVVE